MAHQAFLRGAIIPIVYVGVGFIFGKLYGDYKDVNDNTKITNKEPHPPKNIHEILNQSEQKNDSVIHMNNIPIKLQQKEPVNDT